MRPPSYGTLKESSRTDPSGAETAPAAINPSRLGELLLRYASPNPARGLFELFITALPFALLWIGVLFSVRAGFWPGLLLVVPAAGFLVRLFLIQHDCGHGSFFRRRVSNDLLGRVIGVFTFTPYAYWRQTHAVHHATTGNLNRRGLGDVDLLTVDEYTSLPRLERLAYRLSRHPLALLAIGPFYVFVLKYRLPIGLMREGAGPWRSTMGTNAAIAGLLILLSVWLGFGTVLLVQLPITLLAGAIGIWLFYVQHQFEQTYWEREDAWEYHAGALRSSTHYDLPAVLRWFTANIGIHHIHHLASRIPSYRLGEALREHPEFAPGQRLTLLSSFACFRFSLWDEDAKRLIGFRDLRRIG